MKDTVEEQGAVSTATRVPKSVSFMEFDNIEPIKIEEQQSLDRLNARHNQLDSNTLSPLPRKIYKNPSESPGLKYGNTRNKINRTTEIEKSPLQSPPQE